MPSDSRGAGTYLMNCLTWLIPAIPWCRVHRKWEGWDGYRSYVCPECAETPQYKAYLKETQ